MKVQPLPVQGKPSLLQLFLACFKIGGLSFGGGLSGWLHQEFVLRRAWVSEKDFTSSLAISQILPGANVLNLVICMGDELRGGPGAFVCASGFMLSPFFAVIGLSVLFESLGNQPIFISFLNGMAYAAAGLLVFICWRGIRSVQGSIQGLLTIATVATLVGVLKLPLLGVVAVMAPVSIMLTALKERTNARQ